MNARFARSVSIIPPDVLYLDPYLICDRLNSDSRVNEIYPFSYMTCSLIGEGVDVFFVNWGYIAVCDTSVIMCDDCCGLVHIFDGFKYLLVDFSWIDDGVLFFAANIKGKFCCKAVVDDGGDDGMLDTTITNSVFVIVGGDSWVIVVVAVVIFVVFFCIFFGNLFCGLFFDKLDAVAFGTNTGYSLGWLWVLVFVAHGFDFRYSSWWFWVAVGREVFEGIHDYVCRSGTLK